MTTRLLLFLLIGMIIPACPLADAAEPDPVIVYQGRVMQSGVPVTGTHTMSFTLIDVGGGGSILWSSGNLSLSVTDGLYSLVLGGAGQPTIPASVLNKSSLAVSVTYDGTALAPDAALKPALQARYAFVAGNAATADSATQLSGINDLAHGGTGATSAAEARLNLGLGTASTQSAGDFATAAQGAKADTAAQPAALAPLATKTEVAAEYTTIATTADLTARMTVVESQLAAPLMIPGSTAASAPTNAGAIRWESAATNIQVSDGSQWLNLSKIGVGEDLPATPQNGDVFRTTNALMEGLWLYHNGWTPLNRRLITSNAVLGEGGNIPIDLGTLYHGDVLISVTPTSPTTNGTITITVPRGYPQGCDIRINVVCRSSGVGVVVVSGTANIELNLDSMAANIAPGGSASLPLSVRRFRLFALGSGWQLLDD